MNYQFATTSGSSLYVDDEGTGPDVLALHGVGGGAYFFQGLGPRLAPHYRTLSLDLPGTGRSTSGAAVVTVDGWIRDIGDLVAAKTTRPLVIVGHSLGTILALKAWEAWPERIRGFVFVGGLPEVRPSVRERLLDRIEAIRRDGIGGWGAKITPGIFSRGSRRRLPEIVGLFERVFEEQEPATYIHSLELLLSASAADTPPTVHVPCLVITGSDDQYAPPDSVREFVASLPNARPIDVIGDCGHMPFFEAPNQFAEVVRSFMDSL